MNKVRFYFKDRYAKPILQVNENNENVWKHYTSSSLLKNRDWHSFKYRDNISQTEFKFIQFALKHDYVVLPRE